MAGTSRIWHADGISNIGFLIWLYYLNFVVRQLELEADLELDRLRNLVDDALDRYSRLDAACPAKLRAAIRYMLLAPGKRLRPLLVLMATRACGGSLEVALPAACAVEMIHTYSLVHDDLPAMDNDELRRGQPTCHIKFDEATAILAGDALQPMAFRLLATSYDSQIAVACISELADAAGPEKLVGGQVDDLSGRHAEISLDFLENIHQRKTAALLIAALRMGGITSRATAEQLLALRIFGEKIGVAFQIVDDLLDFSGDPIKMGKQSGNDVQNGTLTFPTLLGETACREYCTRLVQEAKDSLHVFGPDADPLRSIADFIVNREH
ncbi:MAG TPA: polyprenyl synthetase family protein [Pirellulaceae bacterium]|nr:polyprenyl synthetase family protein [Pirellulaceae bacterium]HMO90651.1 polyprenyl synthetase family protein [Pirellulaceae bacterium]HMP67770.1 polyprenyl synthetase family protein [Pirellulaceae bacterium]